MIFCMAGQNRSKSLYPEKQRKTANHPKNVPPFLSAQLCFQFLPSPAEVQCRASEKRWKWVGGGRGFVFFLGGGMF